MEIIFMNSYLRALKKIKNADLILDLNKAIENVENAVTFSEILNVKKLSGFSNCYRIKVNNYRIGLVLDNNVITFVQFEHRKDIYKKFP
ncbi:MAG TPA: plasmid stabilization protein [Flavobacterium sp.]|nr:plasmid stabilization protein [Flavobacterium sp.]HAT77658.1 plasmid stabilization protein [Flavobacterium sp.]